MRSHDPSATGYVQRPLKERSRWQSSQSQMGLSSGHCKALASSFSTSRRYLARRFHLTDLISNWSSAWILKILTAFSLHQTTMSQMLRHLLQERAHRMIHQLCLQRSRVVRALAHVRRA